MFRCRITDTIFKLWLWSNFKKTKENKRKYNLQNLDGMLTQPFVSVSPSLADLTWIYYCYINSSAFSSFLGDRKRKIDNIMFELNATKSV